MRVVTNVQTIIIWPLVLWWKGEIGVLLEEFHGVIKAWCFSEGVCIYSLASVVGKTLNVYLFVGLVVRNAGVQVKEEIYPMLRNCMHLFELVQCVWSHRWARKKFTQWNELLCISSTLCTIYQDLYSSLAICVRRSLEMHNHLLPSVVSPIKTWRDWNYSWRISRCECEKTNILRRSIKM